MSIEMCCRLLNFNYLSMKKLGIIVCVFVHFLSFSQEFPNQEDYWEGEENRTAMIAVSSCNVREQPSLKAKLLDSLQLGQEIVLLKNTDSFLKIKGVNLSWVSIAFKNQKGEIQKAFVWKGFLALGFVKTDQNIFLTSLDKILSDSKDPYINEGVFSVKVLDLDKKILAQKTFKKSSNDGSYFENKNIGSLGLTGLKNIYRVSLMGQACGVTSNHFYWGWTGSDLVELPKRQDSADAGAYYYEETFIFPSEKGGKPNSIIKKIKQAEINDKGLMDVEEWTETFLWKGQKAVFSKKDKPKKYKEKL